MSSNGANDRYVHIRTLLGERLFEKVKNSKIFVVGAGGIGCELLKNLVMSGFENIEIIDLDTIDVSNLNRQFLFRERHIGQSKSKVARESALKFNPHCNIVAHHGNIKHPQFGHEFFKKFDIVMNALDNIDARRHVNRLCLATGVPLIDGGTAGYLGQVMTIVKGKTECYECQPKMAPKTYAVCTIRSNPSTPVHCVVWAKLLFERLFGKANDANAVTNFAEEEEKQDQGTEGAQPSPKKRRLDGEDADETDPDKYGKMVMQKVFHDDVQELINMKAEFTTGKQPIPFDMTSLNNASTTTTGSTDSSNAGLEDQRVWSIKENVEKFLQSVRTLKKRRLDASEDLEFDKDDDAALNFVTAAANIRANCFHIKMQSRFDVKAMAGNIVPAIATTNAVIAGLLVTEALKVLQNHIDDTRMVYCLRHPTRLKRKSCLIYPVIHSKPNPHCYVCSSHFIVVECNIKVTTLRYFVEEILRKRLGLTEPSIVHGDNIIFESGEDADEESMTQQLGKTLEAVGMVNNSVITIEDFRQEISWECTIHHNDEIKEQEDFKIKGETAHAAEAVPEAKKQPAAEEAPPKGEEKVAPATASKAIDDGDIIILETDEDTAKKTNGSDKAAASDEVVEID